MPQALQGQHQVVYSARCVLQRPRRAALIGAICAEWSMAESYLGTFYSELVVGPSLSGVPMGPGHYIASQTFDMASSFRQRAAMLKAAAKARHFDAATLADFGVMTYLPNSESNFLAPRSSPLQVVLY